MEQDNRTLKLREVAAKYMKLQKRNKEIRAAFKAHKKDIPARQANTDVERRMQGILEKEAGDYCHIEGITSLMRTNRDQPKELMGFSHVKIPPTLLDGSETKDITAYIKEGEGVLRVVKEWRQSQRQQAASIIEPVPQQALQTSVDNLQLPKPLTEADNKKRDASLHGSSTATSESGNDAFARQHQVSGALAGLRVIRGPDFPDNDVAVGLVGTVRRHRTHEGTVHVFWDTGREGTYRVGKDEKYDLLVLDPGPAGIRHGPYCDVCAENIHGYRWECITCLSYNMCTSCYGNETHSLSHTFQRYDNITESTNVGTREDATRQQSKGAYVGASVRQNDEYQWERKIPGRQQNRNGTIQKHLYIVQDNEPISQLEVLWTEHKKQNQTINCVFGWRGRVDVIVKKAVLGWWYYKAHLPVLSDDLQKKMVFTILPCESAIDLETQMGNTLVRRLGALWLAIESSVKPTETDLDKITATKQKFKPGDIVRHESPPDDCNAALTYMVQTTHGIVCGINHAGHVTVRLCENNIINAAPELLVVEKMKAKMVGGHDSGLKDDNLYLPGDLVFIQNDELRSEMGGEIGLVISGLTNEYINVNVGHGNDSFEVAREYLIPQSLCLPDQEELIKKWHIEYRPGGTSVDQLCIGDVVCLLKDKEQVRKLQAQNWHIDIRQYLGKCGVISDITKKADIVKISFGNKIYQMHPETFTKVDVQLDSDTGNKFSSGDLVRINQDRKMVEQLQRDHGGWRKSMTWILGMVGTVHRVDCVDDDLYVLFGLKIYCLSPKVAQRVKPKDADVDQTGSTQASASARPLKSSAARKKKPSRRSKAVKRMTAVKLESSSDPAKQQTRFDLINRFVDMIENGSGNSSTSDPGHSPPPYTKLPSKDLPALGSHNSEACQVSTFVIDHRDSYIHYLENQLQPNKQIAPHQQTGLKRQSMLSVEIEEQDSIDDK